MGKVTKNRIASIRASSEFDTAIIAGSEVVLSLPEGGATTEVYSSASELPLIGNTAGDQAYVTGNNRLYLWNGSGWYNVALINNAPSITVGASAAYALSTDGSPTIISLTAVDSDDNSLTWSYSITSGTLGNTASISQDSSVFTITPSSNTADAGSFGITFTASDGISTATSTTSVTLAFVSQYWDEAVLSIGTNSTNGIANSTFIDRSANALIVTPNGSPVQTAFHPYLENWSVEFDGIDGYLSFADSTDWDFVYSGDFTVDFWMNSRVSSNICPFGQSGGGGPRPDKWGLYINDTSVGLTAGTIGWHLGSNGNIQGPSFTPIANTWYYIQVSRASDTWYFFVDGILLGTVSSALRPAASDSTLRIGADGESYRDFNGYLSNVRIVKGTNLNTSSFTPPTEKLTAITNTVLLTCQSNRFIDNSSNAYAITVTGDSKISAFNPFGQESEYAVGENKGSFYSPTNSNQWLRVTAPDTSGNIWECQGWFYLEDFSNWGETSLFSTLENTGVGMVIRIFGEQVVSGAWTKQINIYGRNATPNAQTSTLPIYEFSWFHVLASCDGTNTRIFLNGVEVLSLGVSNWGGHNLIQMCNVYYSNNNAIGYYSDFKFQVGGSVTTSNFTPPTAPVGNTSASLYLPMDNAGIFDKTGLNTLTINGNAATSTTQTKYADTAMYFDGSGDYLKIDNNQIFSGDFTVEFWTNFTQNTTNFPTPRFFVSKGNSAANVADNLQIVINSGDANNTAGAILVFTDTLLASSESTAFRDGAWHHVAVTRSGTSFKLFVDGIQYGSTTTTSQSFSFVDSHIGVRADLSATTYFNGYIENLQILKGVAKYTANFTPPILTQGINYQAES